MSDKWHTFANNDIIRYLEYKNIKLKYADAKKGRENYFVNYEAHMKYEILKSRRFWLSLGQIKVSCTDNRTTNDV